MTETASGKLYDVFILDEIVFCLSEGLAEFGDIRRLIEQRDSAEVTTLQGKRLAPDAAKVYNPAFDVTPHRLISGIITERGIVQKPYRSNLKKILSGATPDDDQKLIG